MDLDIPPSAAQIQSISSSISVGGGSQIFQNVFRNFMKQMIRLFILNKPIFLYKVEKIFRSAEILLISPQISGDKSSINLKND